MTVLEAIKARVSVRSYIGETPDLDFLRRLCADKPQLAPIDPALIGSGSVGTYGCISGRPAYVAVEAGDELQAGIQGEQLVIELTRQGYGTCWLGGTFNRKLAERGAETTPGSRVLAVIAVGNSTGHRSLAESLMRAIARSSSRKPLRELVIGGEPSGIIAEALEAARLAPSAVNRQPWRFAVNADGSVDVFGDSSDSFMRLDVGIAIAHFLAVCPDYTVAPCSATHLRLTPIATLTPHANG